MKLPGFRLTVLLLGIGIAGTALIMAQDKASPNREKTEDEIRESVLRYRMAKIPANSLIFLSINGHDPSDTFMTRFAESNKTVKKASQSHQSYLDGRGVPSLSDRATDQPGWLFFVGSITWLSTERVEVKGGMYCDALCADAGTYLLEEKQGHWVVIHYTVEMVS